MSSVININNIDVIFENKDEQIFCTSLDIAKVFGKRHDNVLADIKLILNELREIGASNEFLNFEEVVRISKTTNPKNGKLVNRKMPMYNLTRDAFTLLAMGFTGKKALQFKIAFINAFNQMEQIIKNKEIEKIKQLKHYDLPDTPYKEKIANAIKEIEQKQNSKFIELIEYEIVEKFKNGKTQVLQKLNFKTKLI
ncbi:Rha family transcriptional regulator [Campylobacter lari]|uniref:Putative antirepressor, Rha family n=1 Tax=Campylobacter lari (strain RM2100 / D67 / ATCC BAA-1060) TaxID=306263 RepID=B9KGH6_CAMLR|nr:Rha family transcriptional regulator [Campylobacter lari]ACM64883.1 putative antirepressor, Rha family [Campylobacter lari RM2100]EAJ0337693.1 phage regulatory protein [Campylobacter lari]EAK9869865.1 phage regulatory protein [Campylobacter lari]MCV3465153.1 Rha family transcriptional regulator [Campylobacter lari]MCV3522243.1 Rha family transcriptional regulator [Campylobacter lari]